MDVRDLSGPRAVDGVPGDASHPGHLHQYIQPNVRPW